MLNTFKKSQDLYKNRPWLTFLVLVTLGTMVCSLFLGCGSDSKPQALSDKKEKTAASSKSMKSRAVLPLDSIDESSGRNVKREPLSPETELAPGLTVAEVEKRNLANRKRVDDPNYEIIPGITKKELDDKLAAEQKKYESSNSASQEILPGITKQDLDARMAAHLKTTGLSNEGVSGTTKEGLNAKLDAERIQRGLNQEVSPGVFKDQLDKKLRQAGKE